MTSTSKPNVIGVAVVLIAASAVAAFALIIALRNPVLFLYYVGLALLLFGAGGYAAASWFRTERDDATAKWQRLERELEARAPGVTMVPHVTFTARTPVAVERPDLHIVPPRDGSDWPALARVLGIEEGL